MPSSSPSIVDDVLSSPGQPLDAGTREWIEPRFGHDFSNVRVHTDARAAKSAQAVNAQAYTVGRDVVFGAGQYAPQTSAGQQLIAHELTHVSQQSASSSSQLIRMGEPDSAAEEEADHVSTEVMRGGTLSGGPSPQSVSLQRQATGAAPQPTSPATSPQANPQPAPSAPDRSSTSNIRLGGSGNFDAELDRRAALNAQRRTANEPCRVTLTVRVRLNFTDTETPSRWTPAEQTRWQNEYIRAVTDRWSFRFLLAPAQACATEPCQVAAAVLHVEPVTSSPHQTVNVLYDRSPEGRGSPSELYRSSVERPGRDLRSNQILATHEVGHMLGLPHVHCNTNDDNCYGTNREESADVMGRGEIVTERDYLPFVTALQQLTSCSWRVRDGQRGPLFGNFSTGLGITLGAAGGIAGGILGASLGGVGGAIVGGVLGAGLGGLIGYGLGTLAD
jgi:hypothetical protein